MWSRTVREVTLSVTLSIVVFAEPAIDQLRVLALINLAVGCFTHTSYTTIVRECSAVGSQLPPPNLCEDVLVQRAPFLRVVYPLLRDLHTLPRALDTV